MSTYGFDYTQPGIQVIDDVTLHVVQPLVEPFQASEFYEPGPDGDVALFTLTGKRTTARVFLRPELLGRRRAQLPSAAECREQYPDGQVPDEMRADLTWEERRSRALYVELHRNGRLYLNADQFDSMPTYRAMAGWALSLAREMVELRSEQLDAHLEGR